MPVGSNRQRLCRLLPECRRFRYLPCKSDFCPEFISGPIMRSRILIRFPAGILQESFRRPFPAALGRCLYTHGFGQQPYHEKGKQNLSDSLFHLSASLLPSYGQMATQISLPFPKVVYRNIFPGTSPLFLVDKPPGSLYTILVVPKAAYLCRFYNTAGAACSI